jgi:thiol-disulfide isomerase/thioredoxin
MKVFARLAALCVSAVFLASTTSIVAQTASSPSIAGIWQGSATVAGGKQVPVSIRISGSGDNLKLALLNGPVEHPDEAPASSVTFDGIHLVASYDYFARKLEVTFADGTLTGTYGAAIPSAHGAAATPLTLTQVAKPVDPVAAPGAPDIHGAWEIATTSTKGEKAWEFRVDPPAGKSPVLKAVIQRIDGDTGALWGTWNGTSYLVGHFNAAGPALYSITPQTDGTLLIKNALQAEGGSRRGSGGDQAAATGAPAARPSSDLIAKRPEEARKENLPAPTKETEQTSVKDPNVPFAFSFPDLSGKLVSDTDAQFHGKVVIVAIGGSWCPNCHDEAPFLVSLYKKFHAKGLEIVNLDFERGDPDTDTARLRAFIAHYGITYPVLVGGTTDQLAEAVPQAVNLNCWPTSFFLGRDGKVKEIHAGFAGPGNTVGHAELERNVTALIEKLLAEPRPEETSSLRP